MIFHITDENGAVLTSNLETQCLDCVLDCSKPNLKIKCKSENKEKRIGKIFKDELIIFLCDGEHSNSTRMFKKQLDLLVSFSGDINSFISEAGQGMTKQVFRLLHNLVTYNAHILQDVYSIIPQDDLSKSGKEIVNSINKVLVNGEIQNSVSILRILKNANMMKSEFSIFNKLYDPDPNLNIIEHQIHKVITLVFNSFWYDLVQNGNFLNIESSNMKIPFDYESVSAALAHIVDNTCKYIAPKTNLNVIFSESNIENIISFEMISMKIDDDEIDKIFFEGYSGRTPVENQLNGKGVGLYMVKRLLTLNDASIEINIKSNGREAFEHNGVEYQQNTFDIKFRKKSLTKY